MVKKQLTVEYIRKRCKTLQKYFTKFVPNSKELRELREQCPHLNKVNWDEGKKCMDCGKEMGMWMSDF
jgi:hypothetical protein